MKRRTKPPHLSKQSLRTLSKLQTEASRRSFFAQHPALVSAEVVQQINDVVKAKLRAETYEALALAEGAVALARRLRDRDSLGRSLRSKANAFYMLGDNHKALELHAEAIKNFQATGNAREEARTLIPSIQPFILLGEYDRAFETAERARKLLEHLGDKQRLGHLEINIGNIYHRQDRFEEGLACYERGYEMLVPFRDAEGLAVALYNMAVCLITLNDFPRALATYQRAREMCVQQSMTLLVTQADYNIAYLYYLRGEYDRAIEMLRATRRACEENGDAHVHALCFLDLSEIYLELNLSAEAGEVAHEGYLRFQKLGMGYEEAKCQANEAMALSQSGKAMQAIELFEQARAKFLREKNLVWPWLADLYQALVLFNEGRYFEARRLCARASSFFEASCLPGKAVLCHLLLARIELRSGELSEAESECHKALARLESLEAPVLRYQAFSVLGQIQQSSGDAGAYGSFQKARQNLETLRSSLRGEELRIAFTKNRLEVYEFLVDICMRSARANAAEESFQYMEMAKSRSLAELLVHHASVVPAPEGGQSGLVRRIREMREELNWYYRRIEREQLQSEESAPARIEDLRQRALAQENELLRALHELPVPGADLIGRKDDLPSVEVVRESLPPDAMLVEYFAVKNHLIAAVLSREHLELISLTPLSRVLDLLRLLHFQIAKFQLGKDYTAQFAKPLFGAVQAHLRQLYAEIFAPLRERLRCRHVIIVPHGALHYLPFHALYDGESYLIDSFSISYAPSASVFAYCQSKKLKPDGPPLVMGVSDAQAPLILEEARAVASTLPGARLLLGEEASEEALREAGAHSRLIHIATHGIFRQDNPMFSRVRLGSGHMSLYDLYQLKLEAELVTLSGCGTGLSVVASGDELMGLARGLLYAGAQSLLLSLWNVHDGSTSDFMSNFYKHLQLGKANACALQTTMQEIRESRPHPYFWAPFILIGQVSSLLSAQ